MARFESYVHRSSPCAAVWPCDAVRIPMVSSTLFWRRLADGLLNNGPATPKLYVDWTVGPAIGWGKELSLRAVRNGQIKEKLLAGRTVCFHALGWQLWPLVHSKDMTTYDPVTSTDKVQVDDIFFLPGPAWGPLLCA